jgi:hypothetical protein
VTWRWAAVGGAAVIFLIALMARLPFGSEYLWAWDSVLYARALEYFDVGAGRPHPPGSLFYVLAGRAAALFTGDANAALVLVSTVAGAATCAVGYLLALRRFGLLAAVTTSLILLANPLLWHYSEVAYPYTLLALLAGGLGSALFLSRGTLHESIALSFALGVAAGFRQDLLLLLGPLWLWSVARNRVSGLAVSACALAAGSLIWLVPSAIFSGGFDRYLGLASGQAIAVADMGGDTASRLLRNATMTAVGLRWQLLWALPLLPVGVWVLARGQRRDGLPVMPLALWFAAPLLTYLLLHIGEWAYVLSLAVPLALVAAVGASALLTSARPRLTRVVVVAAVSAALIANGASFVLGDGRFSRAEIRRHDRALELQIAYIRDRMRPNETILLAEANYLHAQHYLPDYTTIYVERGRRVVPRRIANARVRQVVLFDDGVRVNSKVPIHTVTLSGGVELQYLPMRSRSVLLLGEAVSVDESAN